jgi:hypothetical protein
MDLSKYIIMAIISICIFIPLTTDAGVEVPINLINVNVSPETGALYFNTKMLHDFDEYIKNTYKYYAYNYTYTMRFLEQNDEDVPVKVWLQIYNEQKKSWNYPGVEIDNSRKEKVISKDINLSNEVGIFLGDVRYRVVTNVSNETIELFNSTGPNITANFKEEYWKKNTDKSYTYGVNVSSSREKQNIYLFYKNSSDSQWSYVSEIQTYRNSENKTNPWVKIFWENLPGYNQAEFVIMD